MNEQPESRPRRSGCPINVALEEVGDPWSLLVVRDILLKGKSTYADFLGAEEGIATNILATRLKWLVAKGIIEKERDADDRRSMIYRPTRKGLALLPMMVEMILWSAAHEDTAAEPAIIAKIKSDKEGYIAGIASRFADEKMPTSRSGASGAV